MFNMSDDRFWCHFLAQTYKQKKSQNWRCRLVTQTKKNKQPHQNRLPRWSLELKKKSMNRNLWIPGVPLGVPMVPGEHGDQRTSQAPKVPKWSLQVCMITFPDQTNHKCQQSIFQQPPVESGAAGIGVCTFSCEMGAAILHMSVGMWFHRCAHLVATCALSFFIYPSHT